MAHKTKDCMERPRKLGAKFTNKHIAADEKVQELDPQGWDAKRDRWNGYDADEYAKVRRKFCFVEGTAV
jgi:pre-mRNA-processing factor SLU7